MFLLSRKKSRFGAGSIIWFALGLFLITASNVKAYIDPGTGSYAIQIAIGVIFGAAYTIKSFGGQILKFFKRQTPKNKQDN